MALQFIIGGSGTGKSYYAYEQIIREAACHPDVLYYIVVPEQFTMQTQRTVVEMSPGKGILNIDVLSFQRLAIHVLEEVGGNTRQILQDTGKSMVIRKLAQEHRKELPYLGNQIRKPGYLDEVKSLISEFLQYDISGEELKEMIERAEGKELLQMKLRDISTLYDAFREYLSGSYMTSEEIMDLLSKALPFSEKMKGSVVLFDGFTGFTPIQMRVLRELFALTSLVQVTVTMDSRENLYQKGKSYQLFSMSRRMMQGLMKESKDLLDPILLKHDEKSRFCEAPALRFLEEHLFRYRKAVYEKETDNLEIFCGGNPREEVEKAARKIQRIVRTKGLHYGDIAMITGNLESYGPVIRQVFGRAGIPVFIDETHTVLMNPFVEFLRAGVDMVIQGFSYESVFRYLRCSMSDLTEDEIDLLENYVLALGIRGRKRWEETWVRTYRGISPDQVTDINAIREKFMKEVQEFSEAFTRPGNTIRDYCTALYLFTLQCHVQEKLKLQEEIFKSRQDPAMEKEYAQIYGIVMELLDKMVEILGDEKVTRQEFLQLLETGLREAKVALIPPGQDQLLVGDMERTRLKDIRVLFFLGVNEGNIPKNTESGGILSEMDREFFAKEGVELAPDAKELMSQQRFYLYLNLTKPGEKLILSYARSDSKGEAMTPASLIASLKGMFPKLVEYEETASPDPLETLEIPENGMEEFLKRLESHAWEREDPVFAELYSYYLAQKDYEGEVRKLVEAAFIRKPSDPISRSVAKALYGEISPYSATRLEKYAACAYGHFLQYGLGLTERVEYQFRSMDMGNLIHGVLEEFAQEISRRGLSWRTISEEERNQILDECLDLQAADYGNTILRSNPRREYQIERMRRLLHRTVWALCEQLKKGKFEPEGFEVKFGGGRIDRLDVLEEDDRVLVKVIDYKTGGTKFDLLMTYYGIQMQLLVYMDGALQIEQRKHPDKVIEPAGIFYYNVQDPVIKGTIHEEQMPEDKILKELKMNGLVQEDEEIAQAIDQTLSSIPYGKNKNGSFKKESSVASREQFALLNRYVKTKIQSIRKEIFDGNVEALPYQKTDKKSMACTYCPFKSACGFDRKIPGYEYKTLAGMNPEEIWKHMEEEVKE